MQETSEKKLEKMLNANSGYITRKQVDSHKIPSWFLTDFVRRQGLIKIDKGFYAQAASARRMVYYAALFQLVVSGSVESISSLSRTSFAKISRS